MKANMAHNTPANIERNARFHRPRTSADQLKALQAKVDAAQAKLDAAKADGNPTAAASIDLALAKSELRAATRG